MHAAFRAARRGALSPVAPARPVAHPIPLLLSLALAAAPLAPAARADDAPPPRGGAPAPAAPAAPAGDAAQQQMMAEMMKYASPGPVHEALRGQVGTWKAVITSWNGGPEPVASTGTETNAMILGGRFLESRFKGSFQGQPYEGYGLTGFDNKKNQVLSLWLDTMSTAWMMMTGTMSDDGKTATCTGTVDGPDGGPMDVRAVTTFDRPDQTTYTMYGKMGDKETQLMQIVYTRVAAPAGGKKK